MQLLLIQVAYIHKLEVAQSHIWCFEENEVGQTREKGFDMVQSIINYLFYFD